MRRDTEVNHAPRSRFKDKEEIDGSENEIDNWQEVTRPHAFGVILEERRPILSRYAPRTCQAHILLNGGCGRSNAEFEELPLDALCAPEKIVFGHLLDQGNGFAGQL